MTLWIPAIISFLLGSIPFGLLIAKSKGINIREHGSGNIGATNVLRVVGKKYGITCFILDFLKGLFPAMLGITLVRYASQHNPMEISSLSNWATTLPDAEQTKVQIIQVVTGLCAVLGHNYSPWVGFKGGKGIATSAGVLTAFMPAALVLLIVVWALVFFTTRYVSLASIIAALSLPVLTHLGARFHHVDNDKSQPTLWEAGTWNKPLFFFATFIALMAVWKHRANIQRLLAGTENRFGSKKK